MNKPVDTHLPLADARRLTQRVHFERDGTVTIASGKVDLGQGISTALAQILRPPRPFARLVSIPEHPGLVRDGNFAAVLAAREEDAIEAAKKLRAKAVWSGGPRMPEDIYGWLKQHATENNVTKEKADPL